MITAEQFNDSLADYIRSIKESSSEATIRHRCLEFLQDSLGVSLIPSSSLSERGGRVDFELEQRVFRGRVDAVLGRLVFEFKQDLASSSNEAEAQLRRYLSDLHQQNPEATYTGIACDGIRFGVYRASYQDSGESTLERIGNLDLEQVYDPLDAFLWLDALFAHFRQGRTAPTARSVVVALGASSPTFGQVFPALSGLFEEVKDAPEVAIRYQEWQSYLSIVYGSVVGNDALFVRHTYLSLVARLIARFLLGPGAMLASPEDLGKTIDGDYFREQGIDNFIEDDFFTWLLKSPEIAADALELTRRLAYSLAVYDFGQARQDLLKSLYEELVDPETRHDLGEYYTPDWLAEYILDVELGLSESPDQSVLDPSCGSGTFLFTAIRLIVKARLGRGEDEFDALLHTLDQVMGMDVHPVAVTVARTNYLLALGDLLKGPHPPVLLPVYLSNALVLPGSAAEREPLGGYPEPVHTVETSEPGVIFELPHSVVTNPEMLDWLFARLPNYIGGAEMRQQMQGREEAIQEVLNSFHNYLVAPKPRTPIPEPLSEFAAEVMVGTARRLLQLYFEGKDHIWLFILKNIPASIYLAQRRFDLVVGNPPWQAIGDIQNHAYRKQVSSQVMEHYQLLSEQEANLLEQMSLSALFFARCADLYLADKGRIGMVMPRAVLTAEQHSRFTSFFFKGGSQVLKLEKVLDLEGVSPLFNVPACVLVARNKQQTHYPVPGLVFSGGIPSRNASWEEASKHIRLTPSDYSP
jgi:N-6 DNA Methylase